MSLMFDPNNNLDRFVFGYGSKVYDTPGKNTDRYDLTQNTYLIINYIKLLHCNILNYMPLYISRIIINKTYILADIIKHTPGIKVIIDGILYDIENLPQDKSTVLETAITYSLARAQFPTDTLELYVNLTNKEGV